MKKKYIHWTRKEAVRALRENFPSAPTSREIDECTKCPSMTTLRSLFGTFNNAKIAAGYKPERCWRQRWTEREIIKALQDNFDHAPTVREISACQGCPSIGTIANIFGSVKAAKAAAGYH